MDGQHWYYLHTNGDLIHKRSRPDDGDFVRKVWECRADDRQDAWRIVLEALGMGANLERIRSLASKWNCDTRDLTVAILHLEPNDAMRAGFRFFLEKVAGVDPEQWFDWLAKTPKGAKPDFSTMPTRGDPK